MAKNEYGVKPDIFKITVGFDVGKCSQLFVFAFLLCAVLLLCCVVVLLLLCCVCVVGVFKASPPDPPVPDRPPPDPPPPDRPPPDRPPPDRPPPDHPPPDRPPPDRPKFRSFFSLLPPQFFSFFPLFWSFRCILVFLKAGALKCAHLEFSGCRVKPQRPYQTGPPGLAHDNPRTPNVHI